MFTRGKYKVIYLLKTGNYIVSNQLRLHWKLPWPARSKHTTINGKKSQTADNEGVTEGQTLQDEDIWVVEWEKILWKHWQLKWRHKESKKRGGSGDEMGPRPSVPQSQPGRHHSDPALHPAIRALTHGLGAFPTDISGGWHGPCSCPRCTDHTRTLSNNRKHEYVGSLSQIET